MTETAIEMSGFGAFYFHRGSRKEKASSTIKISQILGSNNKLGKSSSPTISIHIGLYDIYALYESLIWLDFGSLW